MGLSNNNKKYDNQTVSLYLRFKILEVQRYTVDRIKGSTTAANKPIHTPIIKRIILFFIVGLA